MTRSTFNNSGFQARALLDLTFIQHQLKVCTYIELYNMQTILQAATATQTDTNNLQKWKNNFSVDVSVWRWLTMCPADESMVGKNVWSVSKSLQRIDPLCLPVEWQVCTAHPLGQSSAKHNHSRVLNSIRLFKYEILFPCHSAPLSSLCLMLQWELKSGANCCGFQ